MLKIRVSKLLIFCIPVLLLLAATSLRVVRSAKSIVARMPGMVSAELSKNIEGKVTIGRISTTATGLVLHDFLLTDGKDPVVRASQVKITTDIWALLLNRSTRTIEKVELRNPTLFLSREPDGRWNIARIFKPSKIGKGQSFRGKLLVRDARVVVRDRTHKNIFSQVDLRADFSGDNIVWSASGIGPQGRLAGFTARGRANIDKEFLSMDLSARETSLPYWTKYPLKLKLDVPAGAADVQAHIERTSDKLTYSGEVKVHGASFLLRSLKKPVTDIDGTLAVRDKSVNLKLTGRHGNTPVSAVGRVLISGKRLDLVLTSESADLREYAKLYGVSKQLPLPKRARVRARLSGAPSSPRIDFTIDSPTLTVGSYELQSPRAAGSYFKGQTHIQITTVTHGGTVQASGTITKKSATLTGKIAGIRQALPEKQFNGTTSGDFALDWKNGSLSVAYKGTVAGSIRGNPFRGRVKGSYRNGAVTIDEASADGLGGLVAVAGTIAGDTLNLRVAGAEIDLKAASSLAGKPFAVGRGQFDGRITGSVRTPVFTGHIEGYGVHAAGYDAERVAGDIVASTKRISLSDVVVYKRSGQITVRGKIESPMDAPNLDLSITADSLSIEELGATAGWKTPARGLVSANIRVSGRADNLNASGEVKATEASIRDVAVESASARASYENGELVIEEIVAHSGSASLSASGRVESDGALKGDFKLSDFPAGKLNHVLQPYAFALGPISAEGTLAGTLSDPAARMSLVWKNPIINGQKFERLAGTAAWDGGLNANLDLSDGESVYALNTLHFDPSTNLLNIDAEVKQGNGVKIFALLD
ncbi:MAG: hypothetical protein ACYC08_02645, partial [Armatimonadota bacterium]